MVFKSHTWNPGIRFLRKLLSVALALGLLLNMTVWGMESASAESDGMIRVKLTRLGSPSSISFKTSGSYTVGGTSISSGSTLKVSLSSGVLTLTSGSTTLASGTTITVARSEKGTSCGVRFTSPSLGNLFCGDLTFKAEGSAIQTVLRIYIETYLYGVVPYEMSNSFPVEALKAQAVSARTYAMRAKRSGGSYDLTDNTSSQVFKGYTSSYANAIRAVDETRGVCLMSGSSYAQCYYTASNGGQTESAKNVWGGSVSYLTVKDDPYDLENPSSIVKSGSIAKSGDKLSSALCKAILQAASMKDSSKDSLKDAQIVSVNSAALHSPRYASPSRTYTRLTLNVTLLTGGEQRTQDVELDTYGGLETLLGLSINSGNNETISLSETDEAFVLSFRRYGHGVGLSQRGAQWMASAYGMSYHDILTFYYPGTSQQTLTLSESLIASGTPAPSATPVPVESVDGYTTLQEGDSGEAVKALQTKLKELGFFTGTPLGNYKSLTVAAVKAYQAKNNLTVDGVASPALQKRIFEETLPGDEATITPTPTPAPTDDSALRYGDSGESVKTLQRALKTLGYFDGSIGGNYLKKTESAVKAFQAANGLTADGVATLDVQQKILEAAAAPEVTTAPTASPSPSEAPAGTAATVKLSNIGSKLNVRAQASTASKIVGTLSHGQAVTVTGTSGAWSAVGIGGISGYVMTKYLSTSAPVQPTPTPAPTDDAALRYGDSGEAVKAIQRALKTLGYFDGSIGGNYLKKTEGAVKAFQTANGLTADGIATLDVQQKILEAAAAPEATEAPTASPTTAPTTGTAATVKLSNTGSKLNVRAQASTASKIVGTLSHGQSVTVTGTSGAWSAVSTGSISGYVMTKYLSTSASVQPTPAPTSPADSSQKTLRYGDSGEAVKAIQRKLKALGYFNGDIGGNYLKKTESAVKAFQTANGLTADGVATAEVQQMILNAASDGDGHNATVKVDGNYLNVRASDSASSARLGKLYSGERITVLGEQGGWYRIEYGTQTGYVIQSAVVRD